MKTNGLDVLFEFDSDGTFIQTATLPNGEKATANGPYQIVSSGRRYIIVADKVMFEGICGFRGAGFNTADRSEVNLEIFRYFQIQTRIFACSDGRTFIKQ